MEQAGRESKAEEANRVDAPSERTDTAERQSSQRGDSDDRSGTANRSTLTNEFIESSAAGATPLGPKKPRPENVDRSTDFKILSNPEKEGKTSKDEKSLLVLDDYRHVVVPLKDGHGFSHGELSARINEENGLNVRRFQIDVMKDGVVEDIAKSLNTMADLIDKGELKIADGDVLNLSFGVTTSYADASKLLNMDIHPNNVAEKRGEILEKLEAASKSFQDDAFIQEAANINRGIQELQKRGLKVISAAGNNGPDSINLGLLAADKQYSALDSSGQLASYSGKNDFTTDGRGQVDFRYTPVSPTDPTSISEQSGYYTVDGTNVKLPADEFGGRRFEISEEMAPESLKVLDKDLTRDLSEPTAKEFDFRRLQEMQKGLRDLEQSNNPYGVGSFMNHVRAAAFKNPQNGLVGLSKQAQVETVKTVLKPGMIAQKTEHVITAHGTSFVNAFKAKDEL